MGRGVGEDEGERRAGRDGAVAGRRSGQGGVLARASGAATIPDRWPVSLALCRVARLHLLTRSVPTAPANSRPLPPASPCPLRCARCHVPTALCPPLAPLQAYLPTVLRDIIYGISRNKLNTAFVLLFPALCASSAGRAALMFPTVFFS